jgi:hypothetical protein
VSIRISNFFQKNRAVLALARFRLYRKVVLFYWMQLLPDELLREIGKFLTGAECEDQQRASRTYCLLGDAGRPLRMTCQLFRSVLAPTVPVAFYRCVAIAEMLGVAPSLYDHKDPLESPLLGCAPFAYLHTWQVHPRRACACHGGSRKPASCNWSMHKVDLMIDAWKEFQQQASVRCMGKLNIVLTMPSFEFLSEWTKFVSGCRISLCGLRPFMRRRGGRVEVRWVSCEKIEFFL